MPALINTISHKTQIKRNEVFILPLLYLPKINSFQHPDTLGTFEIVFLHHTVFQQNPFHLYGCQGSISHQFQVIFIIEEQCVIALLGKQIIMFPLPPLYFRRFINVVKRQWKLSPLPLQSVIRSVTIDEIIKRFIRFYWLRVIINFSLWYSISFVCS